MSIEMGWLTDGSTSLERKQKRPQIDFVLINPQFFSYDEPLLIDGVFGCIEEFRDFLCGPALFDQGDYFKLPWSKVEITNIMTER